MKYLTLQIAIILSSIILFSCTNTDQAKVDKSVDDFEDWIENQEAKVDGIKVADWNEMEAEYNKKMNALEKDMQNMKAETKEEYNEAKQDFENLKKNYKAKVDNLQVEANNEIEEVEIWMKNRANEIEEGAEYTLEETEEEWNKMTSNIKEGWDNFTDETKENWEKTEKAFNDWKNEVNEK